MKPISKSALSPAFAFTLIFLIALSSMSASVNAATQIFYRSGSYDGWTTGGSGDYWEVYANTAGDFRAYCRKTSNAWALIHADQYYSGGTLTQITVHVTAKNAYVYKNAPWFSKAEAKWWVKFIDVTTGSVLNEDRAQDFKVVEGYSYYQKSFTGTVVGGHTYRVEAGVYVETGYGWFWQYGTAEAKGTIDVMLVVGDS